MTARYVAARFRVRFRSVEDLLLAYGGDIRHGRLFIETEEDLPAGSLVQVRLELDDGQPAEQILARVKQPVGSRAVTVAGRRGLATQLVAVPSSLQERIASLARHRISGPDAEEATATARILVAEDSTEQRAHVARMLEQMGHRVTTATNGLEAVGTTLRDPPDLLLCDVQMPLMDGWQVLRLVRSRPSLARLPVIFLTTLSGERERLRGYRLGVDDYLAKPVGRDELRYRIEHALRRSEREPVASPEDRGALGGDLRWVSLASVLSFMESERRSGAVRVSSGSRNATIHLDRGEVCGVDLEPAAAERALVERLFRVLDWEEGSFRVLLVAQPCASTERVSTTHALLEHARRSDESVEMASRLPPGDQR